MAEGWVEAAKGSVERVVAAHRATAAAVATALGMRVVAGMEAVHWAVAWVVVVRVAAG